MLGKGVHDLFPVLFPRSLTGSVFAYLKYPLTLIGEDLNNTIIQGGSLKKILMKRRTESNNEDKEIKEEKEEKEEKPWEKSAREAYEEIMEQEKDFIASLPLHLLTFQNLTIQEVPAPEKKSDLVSFSALRIEKGETIDVKLENEDGKIFFCGFTWNPSVGYFLISPPQGRVTTLNGKFFWVTSSLVPPPSIHGFKCEERNQKHERKER